MASDRSNRATWGRQRTGLAPATAEEAIRRTEAATADITEDSGTITDDGANESQQEQERPDPAPSAAIVAEERAQQLVANISTQAQAELRDLRNSLDDVIRDIGERRGLLSEAIRSHAEFAEAAIQHKIIIGESIGKLRADFEQSRTPLPPMRKA